MSVVYVVEGTTGEYSDRQRWPVRAYRSEESARSAVVRLDEMARLFEIAKGDGDAYSDAKYGGPADAAAAYVRSIAPELADADPRFSQEYNGTHYRYWPVEMEDA